MSTVYSLRNLGIKTLLGWVFFAGVFFPFLLSSFPPFDIKGNKMTSLWVVAGMLIT